MTVRKRCAPGVGSRDGRGRFVLGNPGGPGRPSRATELDYITAVSAACPPSDLEAITRKAVAQAKEGNPQARRWLSDQLLVPLREHTLRRGLAEAASDAVKSNNEPTPEVLAEATRLAIELVPSFRQMVLGTDAPLQDVIDTYATHKRPSPMFLDPPESNGHNVPKPEPDDDEPEDYTGGVDLVRSGNGRFG